ncbi:MAG: DUF507 family protein [Deltaproteobacteria bacterium]|nr:DUF507 family protein [Deltaproteobacteria bacterium]
MRLKPEESKKLAVHCANIILNDPTVTLKAPRPKILEAIERTLVQHFDEERQIDQKAEALYKEQSDQIEKHERGKAIMMIKKQIAKEKNFILSGAMDGRFSQDKVFHIAHLVADKLYDDDLMDFKDEDEGPKVIKKIFMDYFAREGEIVEKVRKKIMSLAKAPFEGSREWDVLYRKYFEEEMNRLGHA